MESEQEHFGVAFENPLKKNPLKILFSSCHLHDLNHSCSKLLLALAATLKNVCKLDWKMYRCYHPVLRIKVSGDPVAYQM